MHTKLSLDYAAQFNRYLGEEFVPYLDAAVSGLNMMWGSLESDKEREFASDQAILNRKFQRNERLAVQEYNLDMWNRNNEYNDIGSQIARARNAGVNPLSILNGDFKTAQSSPVTSQAAQGSLPNTTTGIGSAIAGNSSNLAEGLSSLMNSGAKVQEVKLNESLINSNIQYNDARIKETLSRAGVNDATDSSIRASTYWMNMRGIHEIRQVIANYTKTYNENLAIFQQIRESMARTENFEANTRNTDASTVGIKIDNAYKPAMLSATIEGQQLANDIAVEKLSQEELNTWVMQFKKDFAIALGLPVDSPEFMFNYILAVNGEFGNYCNTVITPAARATWKPNDYNSKGGGKVGAKLFGLPFEAYAEGESSLPSHLWYGAGTLWNTVAESLDGAARKDFKKTYNDFMRKYRK